MIAFDADGNEFDYDDATQTLGVEEDGDSWIYQLEERPLEDAKANATAELTKLYEAAKTAILAEFGFMPETVGARLLNDYTLNKIGVEGSPDNETVRNVMAGGRGILLVMTADRIHAEFDKQIAARYTQHDRWNITREAIRLIISTNRKQRNDLLTDEEDDALDLLLEVDQWIDDMHTERDRKLEFADQGLTVDLTDWPAPPATATPGEDE